MMMSSPTTQFRWSEVKMFSNTERILVKRYNYLY